MTDVARVAGVSHQTVSRVLNGSSRVDPTTRARVLAAIGQLGYRRNVVARALVTGQTQTLGVVAFDTTLFGPASVLAGIEQAARVAGYVVSIANVPRLDRGSVNDAVDRLETQAIDGIILIAPQADAVDALHERAGELPMVVVDGAVGTGIRRVEVDQVAGARLATQHLLDLGHSTVWHVSGPMEWHEAVSRQEGWRATLHGAGVEAPPPVAGDWSARSGYEAGRLLARVPDLSAVFVANDHMALGLSYAFRERGRTVPDEISVVGFDDIPEAEFLTPPLTTVRQDFGALGHAALRELLAQITREPAAEGPAPIEPELVVRRSTTRPPG
ncbi:MAG TPA: LacI family DNA-binding transcriptional regulator [Jatrophihabitantaceae bacterium]|jgi:DNA-binding LacI/PurR family transcriptional regulator